MRLFAKVKEIIIKKTLEWLDLLPSILLIDGSIVVSLSLTKVSNGWVWGGHNWLGYIKPIYSLKPI